MQQNGARCTNRAKLEFQLRNDSTAIDPTVALKPAGHSKAEIVPSLSCPLNFHFYDRKFSMRRKTFC